MVPRVAVKGEGVVVALNSASDTVVGVEIRDLNRDTTYPGVVAPLNTTLPAMTTF